MTAPLYSTITLFTEIIVTIIILYVFYAGYKKNHFPFKLAGFAIIYEILFNITYMTYRMFKHEGTEHVVEHTPFHIALAAFHGIFSLIMFIALLVYLRLAWKNYKNGINYFQRHNILTTIFIIFWLMAVISGY